jgi:hypothetical protein
LQQGRSSILWRCRHFFLPEHVRLGTPAATTSEKDSLCLCINGTDMDVQFLKAKAREKKAGGSPH